MQAIHDTAKVARNLILDRSCALGESLLLLFCERKNNKKMTPNDILLYAYIKASLNLLKRSFLRKVVSSTEA